MSEGEHQEQADTTGGSDAPPSSPALVGDGLAVGYRTTDEPVVECDHVVLPAGEVTALVGPNGSGKSTLLKTLAGQLDPWAGDVELAGEDVYAMGEKRRARRLGLLSQEHDSPSSTTVEELVRHGRYPHRGFLESLTESDHAAVDRAIERAGVDHLRGTELGQLSGGQKQLAWVAMTLAQEPDVLLLDEPTTFLDLRHQLGVLETVRELNREAGVTVGVVLHDVAQAARFADNLIALSEGSPYDWGPPADVVTEDLLADVFGVAATVRDGPEVVPHRPL
ncbi:ABC transporter ATP-binding protein [Halorarius halobius]|uniref:ABC transporter ATP-binding protein n=1 Tax=Halorarius halobius TaxID=2962671 RepID=UPI0020CBCF06|nr:ABC transporter ATP-binding protein [Halorarius halobius]